MRPSPRLVPILAFLAMPCALEAQPRASGPAASDTAQALHLLRRATFGVRAQDLAEVLARGRGAWLERQLHPEGIAEDGLTARLTAIPAAGMTTAELLAQFPPPQVRRPRPGAGDTMAGAVRRPGGPGRAGEPESMTSPEGNGGEGMTPAARREQAARSPQRMTAELVSAKLVRAVHAERQLAEVLTDFWFNHFNVFAGKNPVRWQVSDYERAAIRPHVFGRFEDMLMATASHPAMLFYLDNWLSAAPVPEAELRAEAERRERMAARALELWWRMDDVARERAVASGRRPPEQVERLEAARERLDAGESMDDVLADLAPGPRRVPGLNENYGRELLELHTLGVDGGYTQQDVIEVARAFTGWTIARGGPGAMGPAPGGRLDSDPAFRFDARMHDGGEKRVLGTVLPAGRGQEDGLDVLRMVARHPATARHVARKLAERFVSDVPPPALVDELARVFLESDGDLRAVTRALFTSPAFEAAEHHGAKVKTPFEFVASALRASGADVGTSRGLVQALRTLGQLPYHESTPDGFPATNPEWVNGGAMLARMNVALQLAAGRIDGVAVAPWDDASAAQLVARLLPGVGIASLEERIQADEAAAIAGLIMGSPEFQRR